MKIKITLIVMMIIIASGGKIEGNCDCVSDCYRDDSGKPKEFWTTKYPSEAVVGFDNVYLFKDQYLFEKIKELKKGIQVYVISKTSIDVPVYYEETKSGVKGYDTVLKVKVSGVDGYLKAVDVIVKSTYIKSRDNKYYIYYNNVGCGRQQLSSCTCTDFSFWFLTTEDNYTFLGRKRVFPNFNDGVESYFIWSPGCNYFYSYADYCFYDTKGKKILEPVIPDGQGKKGLWLIYPRWINDDEVIARNNSIGVDDSIYKFNIKENKITKVFEIEGPYTEYGSGDSEIRVTPLILDKDKKTITITFYRKIKIEVVIDYNGNVVSKK